MYTSLHQQCRRARAGAARHIRCSIRPRIKQFEVLTKKPLLLKRNCGTQKNAEDGREDGGPAFRSTQVKEW